jgi:hypothetical protein
MCDVTRLLDRRILVNHARDWKRLKRGGGRIRLELLDQAGSLAEAWLREALEK